MPIRILLADDHAILRQGLTPLLNAERDFLVIGEAGSGRETLAQIERLQPDVVVLDLSMQDINGLEVLHQLKSFRHQPAVVILTMYDKPAYVVEAMKYSHCSFVLKGEDSSRLVEAIHMAARGERYLSPKLSTEDIERYREQVAGQELNPYDTLTNREREIVNLVIRGSSNIEIANRLSISRRTVEKHRQHAMDKLHVTTQNELIRLAIAYGLLPVDPRLV